MVRAFTDHVRQSQCPAQVAQLDTTVDQLDNEYENVTRSLNLAKAEADSLNAQISGSSASIGPLQSQVTAAETEAEQVTRRRSAYEDLLTAHGVDIPETADEFWNLREELLRQATELLAKVERNREASTDAEYAQKAARITRDGAAKELKRVEHVGSALPEFALIMHETISAAVGVDAAALPHIAELLDLKSDQTRWRPRRKVLRGVGLRLMVPDQHWTKVLQFVNETNMRGRLQIHHVRAKFLGAEALDPEPNALAGKLFVVNPKHPCAAEAVDVIAAAGDHICVDTPDVFARFRRAVTDTGLHKDSDRLAIKDDRRPLKQSEYPYQGDVSAKINALTVDLAAAEETYQKARRVADDIAAQRQQWRDSADGHADRLREQYELLLAEHPDIEALNARADECCSQIQKLMAFCLAGALSFNLASPESTDNRPVFAQLMLDEAFSKSDPQFAQQALQAFRKFGFQLVIVATVQNATTIQPYIDSVVMVSKTEATGRNARPVATRTISEFDGLRREMRASAKVPAGV